MKIILPLILLIPNLAFAFKPLLLHSGKTQVNLLELKVSDGCDACDPEEKWVSELRTQKTLWKKFVPLIEKPGDNGTYPAFLLNGDSWTWADGSQALPKDSDVPAGELNVARQRLQEFDVSFTPVGKIEDCTVFAHFLDHELFSVGSVTKRLRRSGQSFTSRILVAIPKGKMAKIKSVVFWVTDEDGKIVQAVGSNLQVE
jgi:hypothetical protein